MMFRSVAQAFFQPIVSRFRLTLLLANLLLTAFAAKAQTPEHNVGDSLRSLASRASVAFVGQVTRIECHAGVVDITFAVDQPVLGQVGPTFRLREWAGLWSGGQQHFALGQRSMIFVHAPTASGLMSTVDGDDGIVPVTLAKADSPAIADLRRLAARLEHSAGTPLVAGNAMPLPSATVTVSEWRKGLVKEADTLSLTAENSNTPGVSLALR